MKNNLSSPYRTFELKKVEAPARPKGEKKNSAVRKANSDLRCGGKK